MSQAVDQVALGSSANPCLPGELMTFGVLAIPLSGGATPTGTIQFQIDGERLRCRLLPLAGGAATSGRVTSLSVGSHSITAIYSGDCHLPGKHGDARRRQWRARLAGTRAASTRSLRWATRGPAQEHRATCAMPSPRLTPIPAA